MMWESWAQQPDETAAEWEAFVIYRDLRGKRSISECARKAGLSASCVARLARRGDWEARCRAWEAHVDAERRRVFLELQRETIKAHVAAARMLRKKAVKAIGKISEEQLAAQPRVALLALEAAVKIEQSSLGIPTEVTALRVSQGEPVDPNTVYFDALPQKQLLDLGKLAVQELERQQRAPKTEESAE